MIENIADLFKNLSHGVYVIGVSDGMNTNAFTAAWVMQVSFKPPLLAFAVNPDSYSFKLLQSGGVCSVNVLAQDQLAIAGHFGYSRPDKMAGFAWRTELTGAPILAESLAYFDCKVSHYADSGDHQLVVCEVLAGEVLNQGSPMLYSQTGAMDGSSALY
jgi:flavin reductase (DIM6/NTAB) family NADH-FMN oxidoreductase RutF